MESLKIPEMINFKIQAAEVKAHAQVCLFTFLMLTAKNYDSSGSGTTEMLLRFKKARFYAR